MSQTQVKRHRPRLNTTISPYTLDVLKQISAEHGFGAPGQTLDFIVHDWVGLKRAVISAAQPKDQAPGRRAQ